MKVNKILAVTFAIIILVLPILTAFSPKSDFSESENRELASPPSFSFGSIMDKSFMNGVDNYISDHFIGRDLWVQVKSKLELLTMKKENNSILLTNNNTLVEELKAPDTRKLDQNIQGIRKFAQNNPNAKVYTAVAPTSCGIYPESLPYGKKTWKQDDKIKEFYHSLGNDVYGIDLYTELYANKDSYIYYNTDHHWTTLGAYHAYTQIASDMNFVPYEKSGFDIEHASNEFYGTYFSKSKISVDPDTIDIYTPANTDSHIDKVVVDNGKETISYDDIYFRDWLNKKDKYSVFLGQVQPKITVNTNVENDKKLLIFKDSYAHSLLPFLSLHYSEITLIDLRYTNKNYRELVNMKEYDSVLLLYNIESIISDTSIAALGD